MALPCQDFKLNLNTLNFKAELIENHINLDL
jgi:hypothetical protein